MRTSETRIPVDAGAAAAARRFVSETGFVSPDRIQDIVLLVSELATNAVKHGTGGAETITVTISRTSDAIRVTVAGAGPGFDKPAKEPIRLDRGVGLRLVDRLSTRWGIESDGRTAVWFEFDD